MTLLRMGLWDVQRLARIRCIRCGQESFTNPEGWPCTQCVNALLAERHSKCTVMYHLRKNAHFPHSLAHAVFEYVQRYGTKLEFNSQYIVEMILAGGSRFRLLLFVYNECCTTRSEKINHVEDPVDHIIEFVVGERPQ